MHHSSRSSFGTAFTLGIGAGIFINAFIKKLPATSKILQWVREHKSETFKPLTQKIHSLKEHSAGLIKNPIPDLYKATDSLTLSEEDLIHASD